MLHARPFHASGIMLSIAVTTFTVCAHAQTAGGTQASAADTLWEQALEAMGSQDYATACPKIQEVVRLRPDGLGAKIKLAECYEGAGRLASAWAIYVMVEPLAAKANQTDRQKSVHVRVEALRPRLAMLTLVVPDSMRALPGVEVRCDDKVVEPAQWGVALPADKGRHVIVVTATGRERGERVEHIEADGVNRTVTVDHPSEVKDILPPKLPESKRSVAPAVVLGLLAAGGIGSGIALMMLSASKKSEALALRDSILEHHGSCVPNLSNFDTRCGDLQDKLRADAKFYNIAVGTFIAGGGAAAGTLLYVLWPSPRAKTAKPSAASDIRLTPILGPSGSGILVSGRF